MAAPAGNGMYVVTQYIPYANFNPAQQGASPSQGPNFLKRFNEGEPKTLGAIQIMSGILQIFLGAFLCASPLSRGLIIASIGMPFWASIFYIISGALSVVTERNGTLSLSDQQPTVSVLLILSILEFCLGLSTSIFGCKAISCSDNTMEVQPMLAVQHNYPAPFGNTVGQPAGMPVPYTVSSTPDVPLYRGEAQVQRLPTAPEMTTLPTYYMNCPGDGIQS